MFCLLCPRQERETTGNFVKSIDWLDPFPLGSEISIFPFFLLSGGMFWFEKISSPGCCVVEPTACLTLQRPYSTAQCINYPAQSPSIMGQKGMGISFVPSHRVTQVSCNSISRPNKASAVVSTNRSLSPCPTMGKERREESDISSKSFSDAITGQEIKWLFVCLSSFLFLIRYISDERQKGASSSSNN